MIHFGTGTATLLELQRDAGGTVIGLDWRIDLDMAWQRLGLRRRRSGQSRSGRPTRPPREIATQARRILAQAGGRPGHIFNLGHGILPQTPVDNVRALIDIVHTLFTAGNEPLRIGAGIQARSLEYLSDQRLGPAHWRRGRVCA